MAFYPICLVLVTYACIKLHDNNFRPVFWVMEAIAQTFCSLQEEMGCKSVNSQCIHNISALSFSKILFVSFTLLRTFDGRYSDLAERKCFLYYNATVECSTQKYYVFVAIAVCVLVIFIAFPTVLLIVYPTRLFRKWASCCGFQRWHALHMFVESFQGQYKDGTNGTRDFRMVSAFFLILRILIVASFSPHHWSQCHAYIRNTVCSFHRYLLFLCHHEAIQIEQWEQC